MASVIIQDQRTLYLESILDRFLGPDRDVLYLGIGRTQVWPNEENPPLPANTLADRADFFDNLIGAQLILTNAIAPVIRRIDWDSGSGDFVVFDENSDQSFTTNFYCLNTERRVYKLISKTNGAVTATEPLGTGIVDNNGGDVRYVVDTADGHIWQYMYTVDTSIEQLLTNNWLPVSYKDTVSTEQTNFGVVNAYQVFGTNHFIVRSEVSDPALGENISYRQIAILSNITDSDGNILTGATELASTISNSGLMFTLENRSQITRSPGQSESFSTVFKLF